MAITYVGRSSAAADNAYCDDGVSFDPIAWVASLATGDLVLACQAVDSADAPVSVTQARGHTWNPLAAISDGVSALQLLYTRYNGSDGGGAPAFACAHPGDFNDRIGIMLAFRPTSSSNLWTTDVAQAGGSYSAPGSPFDVDAAANQTPTVASSVTLAFWSARGGIPTWALQSGGFTNPGGQTQWRCTANSVLSLAAAYKIQTSIAAAGLPVNRQSAAFNGQRISVTFAEISTSSGAGRRLAQQRNHRVLP